MLPARSMRPTLNLRPYTRGFVSNYPEDTPAGTLCRLVWYNFNFPRGMAPKSLRNVVKLTKSPYALLSNHQCSSPACRHDEGHLRSMLSDEYWNIISRFGESDEIAIWRLIVHCTLYVSLLATRLMTEPRLSG
jgi:hypothetical protein